MEHDWETWKGEVINETSDSDYTTSIDSKMKIAFHNASQIISDKINRDLS